MAPIKKAAKKAAPKKSINKAAAKKAVKKIAPKKSIKKAAPKKAAKKSAAPAAVTFTAICKSEGNAVLGSSANEQVAIQMTKDHKKGAAKYHVTDIIRC